MLLEEYLAVPYLLTAYSAVGDDGRWHRYVEYEELGCLAEGDHVIEAIDRLEEMRVTLIAERFARGEEIPVPRPPLRSVQRAIEARAAAGNGGLPAAARTAAGGAGSRG